MFIFCCNIWFRILTKYIIIVVILVALVIVVVVVSPVDADDDEDHGGEVEAESAEECENFASHVSGKPKPE